MAHSLETADPHRGTRPTRHPAVLVVAVMILGLALLLAVGTGTAQAAGNWTTGLLTNNSVNDAMPHLSSSHVVWAQEAGAGSWDIRLRDLSTGATATIMNLLGVHHAPTVGISGDYVVAGSDGVIRVHRISTGETRTLDACPTPGLYRTLIGIDAPWVVTLDWDGIPGSALSEIAAYNVSTGAWTMVTDNAVFDGNPRMDDGRMIWERSTPVAGGSDAVHDLFYEELGSSSYRSLFTSVSSSPLVFATLAIKGDWAGYFDRVAGDLHLIRLSDDLNISVNGTPSIFGGLVLTSDYAFWTKGRTGGPGGATDLYALHLATQRITRLTDDASVEWGLQADGNRLVYMRSTLAGGIGDFMVVDMVEPPAAPYRLAQNVTMQGTISLSGDYIVAALSDGHDAEIAWAMWVEDTDDGGTDDGSGDDGGTDDDGSSDGGDGSSDDGDDGDSGDGDSGGTSITFSDVAGSPYEAAIYDLASRDVIAGYEDGTFRPTTKVSRQQFAKMIVKALGFPITGSEVCPFTDVAGQIGTDPFYPAKYVAVCASTGITQGKTDTSFAPYDDITHQQLITMVVRAADLGSPPAGYDPGFSASQFSLAEHYENARKAAYAGLLDELVGIGPTYDFLAASTRGECAQLLYNLARS